MQKLLKYFVISIASLFWLGILMIGVQYISRLTIYTPANPEYAGAFPAQPLWFFEVEDKVVCKPIIRDQRIFIDTSDQLYELSNQGNVVHALSHPNTKTCPGIAGNKAIYFTKDSRVVGYDILTGKLLWESAVFDDNSSHVDALAMGHNLFFVASAAHFVKAYDIEDGSIAWELETPGHTVIGLDFEAEMLFMSAEKSVYVYYADTGYLFRKIDVKDFVIDIHAKKDILYVLLGGNDSITAIDWKSEETIWDVAVPNISETLVAINDKIYVSSHQITTLLQDTGRCAWESSQYPMLQVPVLYGDYLFVRDNENGLYMLRSGDGQELGKLLVKPFAPSPSMAEDLLIVPFGDGRVFAYKP